MEQKKQSITIALTIVTMLIITLSSVASTAIMYKILTEIKSDNQKEVSAYRDIDYGVDEEFDDLEEDTDLDQEAE